MSSVVHVPTLGPAAIRPLLRREYDTLVGEGLFADEHVELLHGMIVQMSPMGPPHASTVERLTEHLIVKLHGRATVRAQSSLAASDRSEPEPDIAVVEKRDYSAAHPASAWLVVEVADSSLRTDREVKSPIYAAMGVDEYWIVNLEAETIEIASEPKSGVYRSKRTVARGESAALSRFPDVVVAVDEILPKR